jgi:L-lysine 2,3-aminomutase
MKDAPLNVTLGAVVFFWHLGKELLKSTMDYLVENPQMDILNKHSLENGGDGILQSMHLLREMLDDLMKLPNYQLTSA